MRNLIVWLFIGIIGFTVSDYFLQGSIAEQTRDLYLQQFTNDDRVTQEIRNSRFGYNHYLQYAGLAWFGGLIYLGGTTMYKKFKRHQFLRNVGVTVFLALTLCVSGCMQPFQKIQLEEIGTNEEGFLIPYTGDVKKQTSTNNEQFLKDNLVSTKQVQIPQQWVQLGYNSWISWNGEWRNAAKLIKVDKAPVTREWTADSASGTSNKNEAIWVMTSDQVEFSTGWTITARISSRDDAVKFLHNYPNGSLINVLDTEVRAKIQADFGMEVTDLPMDELRKNSAPHMKKVIDVVEKFFLLRGITITNLGITGGFVYKNPSIQEKLVEVFNSEQEKNISIAKTQAQAENNKRIQLEAEGKSLAILTEKKAEADGIKAVADAKAYEIQKAKEDLTTYLALKRMELETARMSRWDGKFPTYFIGNTSPDMLLNMPALDKAAK